MSIDRPSSDRRIGRVRADRLAMRRAPTQPRAQRSVERLLDEAARLLDAVGVEGFNTNALAARAGMTPPVIYRWFPNKHAVLAALAERFIALEQRWLDDFAALANEAYDVDTAVGITIDGYVRGARAHVGVAALRQAMRALPALAALEERALATSATALQRALRARNVRLAPRDAGRVARLIVDTASTAIDRSLGLAPREARAYVQELARMITAYLRAMA